LRTEYRVPVVPPYRLDLTVAVLRRLSTNPVDIFTPEGHYVRVLAGFRRPLFAHVAQAAPHALSVTLDGDTADHQAGLASVGRILGVDRDVTPFIHAAARIAWLSPLAKRMLGVKPPRYPTLWEACVNAVVFQQLSLIAASAITGRMIDILSPHVESEGFPALAFPDVQRFLAARDRELLGAGLSAVKVATLRRIAEAIVSDELEERVLEGLPSPEAANLLSSIKGIGPWTATVILLRGLGRLDVFPAKDSSVARNLAAVAGQTTFDIAEVLDALGAQRGMLYYHLLLARLESRGGIGRASL